ncbi:MAG: Ig-like domain-containing protein, partial [Alphaproteobacteria bacterium]|nr:Ig-like domain-containing protein [Alphaproteobacteria bacterium]
SKSDDPAQQAQAELGDVAPTVLTKATGGGLPEIAPIAPGDLLPWDGDAGGGVGVAMVGPQGPQSEPLQAVVVFDRPMVALADIDNMRGKVPLSCGPGIAGEGRWAGTSTAVWLPEGGRFPKASEVTCTVKKGTVAVDGVALEKDVSFGFTTAPPEVKRTFPWEGSVLAPDDGVLLVFNQPVDPDAVASSLILEREDGKRVAVKVGRPPEPGAEDRYRLPRERERAVWVTAPLEKDAAYTLTLSQGMKGLEGSLGLSEDYPYRFRTIPPAGIRDVYPEGGAVDPYTSIRLDLATETDGASLNPKVSITPEPPDGWDPPQDYSSSTWWYSLRLEPTTTYTVTVEAGAEDVHGQRFDSGRSWSFTTGHLSPLVDAPSGLQLYPANNPRTLPVRSRNVGSLYGAVKRVDAAWAMEHLDDWRIYSSSEGRQILGQTAIYQDLAEKTDKVRVDTLDLEPALEGGRGLVLVEVWSPELRNWDESVRISRTLLQVTDLGTTLKQGPEGVTAWVTRLSDGSPVAGAEVEVYLKGRGKVGVAVTDADGLASVDLELAGWNTWSEAMHVLVRDGDDVAITGRGGVHSLPTWDFGVYNSDTTRAAQLSVHAFADRGVYKAGETAHIAFNARVGDASGLSQPQGGSYTWTCGDARSQEIGSGKGKLGRFAEGSFDVAIPEELSLGQGYCNVSVEVPGVESTSAYVDLPVFAYRAPSFRVDVAGPEHLSAGDTLKATGQGRYLFGAAMGGAEAKWSVRATEVEPNIPHHEGYRFTSGGGRAWWERVYYPTELVDSGEGKLDDKGELPISLEIPTTETPATRELEIEVTVTDLSRQRISNRSRALVHPSDVYVGLRSTTGVGKAGEAIGVEMVVVSPEGEARPKVPVEVSVARRSWDVVRQKDMDGRWTWVSTANDEVVHTETVASKDGPAVVRYTPSEAGYYVFTAKARDTKGRLAESEDGVYVAGPGASWARSDSQVVELVPDKPLYSPGDTAKLLVKAPKPGLSALVTVEREGVLDKRVVKLATAAETIEIPLGGDAVPNVFVSVVLVDGAPPADSPDSGVPQHYLGYRELKVDPEGRRLSVGLETNQSVYQPGEEVQVSVSVQRDGEPAANAHVVLWAVDYGVLSLTGYERPEAFDTYYADRPLRVASSDNRTRVLDRGDYLAKGAEDGGGGGADGPATRTRFVTTPFWDPGLVTDAQGNVSASFKLPDNLTTFQLMAVVDEGADAFGGESEQIRVTRPLIARPALPRVLRVGDRASAGVVVHNNRDEARTVAVTADATGVSLKGSPVTVTVPAQGAVEVPFALSGPLVGEASFRFDVEAGGDRDAVEVKVPVVRPVPSEVVATAGSYSPDGDAVSEALAKVDGAIPGVGGLEVQVASTVLVGADASLEYLVDYPHGCLEQTSSRMLALLVAKELGPRAGAELPEAKVEEYLSAGWAKIATFEHASGGYAYWPGSRDPSILATAHAVEVLHRGGKAVRPESIRFLREVLSGRWFPDYYSEAAKLSSQARVALTLARVGQGDAGFNAKLYASRKSMSHVGKAELAETIARTTSRDARTAALIDEIMGTANVEATRASLVEPEMSRYRALWWGESLLTAAGLSALMQAQPDHPLLPRLARGLVQSRTHGRWANTYTTARAFAALGAYVEAFEDKVAKEVVVTLSGEELLRAAFTDVRTHTARVPMDDYEGGELSFSGDGRVYYETRLRYAKETMPPRDAGFTLARGYSLLEGGGAGGQVTPGALLQVELRVTTPVDRYDVAVIDPLPAGLEAVDTFFATTASSMSEEEQRDSGYGYGGYRDTGWSEGGLRTWSDWVFDHREMRDDGVYLYASYMPAGIHTYTYYARATTPGDYAHPASTVEEMYAPEIFGRTEAGRFVVGPAPVAKKD